MDVNSGHPASIRAIGSREEYETTVRTNGSIPFLTQEGSEEDRLLLDLATERVHRGPAGRPALFLSLPLDSEQSLEADLAHTEISISRTNHGHPAGLYSRRSPKPHEEWHDRVPDANARG
jgi:hypothetical protein